MARRLGPGPASRPHRRVTASPLPSLGFISIDAEGRAGQPPSQSEILKGLFAEAGFTVRSASSVRSPAIRTGHQLVAASAWGVDVLIISVYSGRSFLYADLTSLIGSLRGSTRVVLVLHGGELPQYGAHHRGRVRRVLARADLIVAPSRFLADVFQGWGYHVAVIPNVLTLADYEYTRRSRPRPALLWMRTFHEHYDPLLAVDVVASLVPGFPDIRLTMGGADHGLLDGTRERVQALGVGDHVRVAGYLDAIDKRAAMRDHDIFLNTNRVDNTPVSVLEASACGLVTVATRVGGIPSMLTDDVDSVLVPPGDAVTMAAQIASLLRDPERFERLSVGARSRAEKSAWPAVKARWLEELRRL